jgi:two-component system response regulator
VLLVEDHPADVRLTVEALKALGVPSQLTVANDGVEALATLRERTTRKETLPHIVLLDLNLPRMDGRELLKELKGNETFKHIPVVILTTSQAEQDVLSSYNLGANAFIHKPADLDQFFDTMKAFATFWLGTATLWRQ